MSSNWETHSQEAGISNTAANISQNGNGRAIGATYSRNENFRAIYNAPQPIQGMQRLVGSPAVHYSGYNRSPAYFNSPVQEMRPPFPSPYNSRGKFYTGQRGQRFQRCAYTPVTRGNSDYLSNTYNVPIHGTPPMRTVRMPAKQLSSAPTEQFYQHDQMAVPVASVQPRSTTPTSRSLPDMTVTAVEQLFTLYLQPVVVGAGENVFRPASGIHFSQSEISFAVKCKSPKIDSEEVRVVISETRITEIVYTPGIRTNKYLAFLLTDTGRLSLPETLQVSENSRYWDLVFYVKLSSCCEKDVLSRLTGFYGSRVKYVATNEWKTMPDLSRYLIRVMRFARILPRLVKHSEGQEKNDHVSQESASAENSSIFPAEREVVSINRDGNQLADTSVLAAAGDLYTIPKVSNSPREEQEDRNNNVPGSGVPAGATTSEHYSSTWNAVHTFEPLNTYTSLNADGCQEKVANIKDCTAVSASVNDYEDTAGPSEKYGSVDEFFSSFTGFDDVSDFPTDFLEAEKKPDVSSKEVTKAQVEPLTLEDDGDAVGAEELKFTDGVTINVNIARENLLDGALMNGDVASFYIVHYIPHAMLPKEWPSRGRVYFANSDMFPMIIRKCRDKLLQEYGGEEVPLEKVKKIFSSRKGAVPLYLQKLLEAELSVIPIFWENHWILGLLQMYAPEKNTVSGRLVIMDSKYDDVRNRNVLRKIAETAHHCIRIAIHAGLFLLGDRFRLKNFPLIRCECLPCQENGVDCGWFMGLYAEWFVKDMSWMDKSDDEVRRLQLSSEETKAFRERIRNIRREVGNYMEKYTRRHLNFDYETRSRAVCKSPVMPQLFKF